MKLLRTGNLKLILILCASGFFFPSVLNAQINNHQHLNINDVEAGINVGGPIHCEPPILNPDYEVPKGSGRHTVNASSLWIGGLDPSGQLHCSAETYAQTGSNYWPGPIGSMSIPFDSTSSAMFDKIWKIDRWKLEEFIYQFSIGNVTNGTYIVPQEIATWPAKGNGVVNDHLAPFVDVNADGNYNVMDGDYPEIIGDQMLYYIFNDALGIPSTSFSTMGIEVQVKAYAFNCTGIADSNMVLNWTTFYNYTIINRRTFDYDNVHTGFWTNLDRINEVDWPGCDTTRAAAFSYSGDSTISSPIQNIKMLRGTLADPGDLIDNDLDGIIDEPGERTSMNHFLSYINVNISPVGNPVGINDIFAYMESTWLDGQHLTYGSDGRDPSALPTNFMFSGVPFSPSGWSAINSGLFPEDRFYLLSSDPVSLDAGDTLTFDIAYVFSWDSLSLNGLTTSIARNQADLDRVQYWFDNNNFPSCEVYAVSVPEMDFADELSVGPNPAFDFINVMSKNKSLTGTPYTIFNLQGKEVKRGWLNENKINISTLESQAYFIRIELSSGPVVRKLIKM